MKDFMKTICMLLLAPGIPLVLTGIAALIDKKLESIEKLEHDKNDNDCQPEEK